MNQIIKNLIFTGFLVLLTILNVNTVSAQTKAGFTLTSNQETVKTGDTLQVTINMNTGGQKVNSFIAQLSYPQDKLTFESVNTDTSPFSMALEASGGDGTVKIIRGSTTSQTGELFIAKVTFKALSAASAKDISFSNESAILSYDNKNILPESIVTNNSNIPADQTPTIENSGLNQSNFFVDILNSIISFFTSLFK
jgi:hypothetical protein